MFDTGGGGLSANAVGSKNTEAGVYKSEAFMPAGVNKYDPFILLYCAFFLLYSFVKPDFNQRTPIYAYFHSYIVYFPN